MLRKYLNAIYWKLRGPLKVEEFQSQGMSVGENFSMQQDCLIDYSHCWLISIGDNVTLAPRVHILAHDASTLRSTGYTKIGEVVIGNDVFVGAGTIILPNTHIGDKCIIGAGSVVSKDIPANSVAAGSPAKVIMSYDDYASRHKKKMTQENTYDESFTMSHNVSNRKKQEMRDALKKGVGYVR